MIPPYTTPTTTQQVFQLGSQTFSVKKSLVYDAEDEPVALRAKSLSFMLFLLQEGTRVVSKTELAEAVWPGLAVTDESISQCASDIRRLLNDKEHAILETFPKQGYRLNAQVKSMSVPSKIRSQRAVVGVSIVLLASAAIWFATRPVPVGLTSPLREVLAVLPFQNLHGEADVEPITIGFAQDLTIRLAELPNIGVIPSSLSFSLTDHGLEAVEAAKSLGARYVIDGSVYYREDDLRISIELIDGAKGTIDWARSYDGSSLQLVEFRDRIIKDIAAGISGTIAEKDLSRLGNTGTKNPEAYKEILLGRQAAAVFSKDMNHAAEKHFRIAIELDVTYARAYAELAAIYAIRFENGWTVLTLADEEKSLYFAEKALSLDPNLWLAHYAMGRLQSVFSVGDFSQAEQHLKRAMVLQPANDDARIYYGAVKIFQGKADEAIAIVEPVLATHPNPPFWYYLTLGHAHFHVGNHAAAALALDQCLSQMALSPYCLRFQIANYGAMGRTEDAAWLLEEYEFLGFDTSIPSILKSTLVEDPRSLQMLAEGLRAAGASD